MERPRDEHNPLHILPRSLLAQRQDASRLPLYPVRSVDVSTWLEWSFVGRLRLRLPPELVPQPPVNSAMQLWSAGGEALLLLMTTDGTGLEVPSIGMDAEPNSEVTIESYSIQVSGNVGTLVLLDDLDPTSARYHALVTVAVDEGFGLGIAAEASTAKTRDELIAAISAMRIT